MSYKTGEVAKLSKVSIKTLHHYDAIGLLVPTGRSDSGYRLYSMQDLERLQQILFYKTLEFPLQEILRLMTAPAFDQKQALLQQRELIEQKSARLVSVLGLINKTIAETEEDVSMSDLKEMFEVFPEINEEMVKEEKAEWGHTDEYKESRKRAANYSKEDWERIKAEGEKENNMMTALFKEGVAPEDARAIEQVDKLRLLIDKWHFPCSKELHTNIADMTRSDERFLENIDKEVSGLAEYIYQAAQANLN